jgi:hypothetical protein
MKDGTKNLEQHPKMKDLKESTYPAETTFWVVMERALINRDLIVMEMAMKAYANLNQATEQIDNLEKDTDYTNIKVRQ